MKTLRIIGCAFLGILLIVTITIIIYILRIINATPPLDLGLLYPQNTTEIYDKNNNLIYEVGTRKQEYTSINEMSPHLLNAIVAIEDNRFNTHNGLDYQRILGAMLKNIKGLDYLQGASTITQQLVKNVYLDNDKNIERKIREMYLSIELENRLSKDKILEAYLNNVLFGKTIYGIKKASNYYFGKLPLDLTISEAALLAGIVQLPNALNPYYHLDDATERRNLVLKLMFELNYISKSEYEHAIDEDIEAQLAYSFSSNFSVISSYIDYVLTEAVNEYGIDPYSQGVKIYTNLDYNLQSHISSILENKFNHFPDESMNSGIVVLDNEGLIIGLGGNRNQETYGINYATNVELQPGSTIKPILDYAPAFEYLKYGTGSIILDSKMSYKSGQIIRNWDGLYKGNITIREALVQSRNVPSVKLFTMVGEKKAFAFASKMGINPENEIYESNAIGGFSQGYTVLEMANAYLTFANMGEYMKASTIRYIEGDTIIANNMVPTRVMSKETAYMINDILHDVSTLSKFDIKGMYVSAKTGQTNYDSNTANLYGIPLNATKDSWYIGYTPNLTIAVWTGYDLVSSKTYLTSTTKEIPKQIWYSIMSRFGSYNNRIYDKPDNINDVLIEKGYSVPYLPSSDSPFNMLRYELFIKGTEPLIVRKKEET